MAYIKGLFVLWMNEMAMMTTVHWIAEPQAVPQRLHQMMQASVAAALPHNVTEALDKRLPTYDHRMMHAQHCTTSAPHTTATLSAAMTVSPYSHFAFMVQLCKLHGVVQKETLNTPGPVQFHSTYHRPLTFCEVSWCAEGVGGEPD